MNDVAVWAAVVVLGLYHGLNPAMGWPLAVANGLGERRGSAVAATWMPLGAGHLLAMALVLVPFALLTWLVQWSRELRLVAGAAVVLFGVSRFWLRRHPRWLARVRPTQLALWSFLMATAHGAALMLIPVLLGLCAPATPAAGPFDHASAMALMRTGLVAAISVSLVHTAAMIASGLGVAWLVYRYLGLQALRSAWFDLDRVWALGLVVSGAAALATAWRSSGLG
jgi:hypothetical protein